MQDKHVLVLFYDQKDKLRPTSALGHNWTLEDSIKLGFEGAGIGYKIRTASPRHEPWLVQYYMNEQKYDGIIIVGGLSCSLDIPNMLMEELYDRREIKLAPRDWKKTTIEQSRSDAGITAKHEISIDGHPKSNYYEQERRVPIIGVPTADPHTYGQIAFASMLMSSRPSEAACVGVEQGYEAARLMARMLTNNWNEVKILHPQIDTKNFTGINYDLGRLLDAEFKPYDDCGIHIGSFKIDEYAAGPLNERAFERQWTPASNALHVCFYDDFSQLERIAAIADFVIGVATCAGGELTPEGKIDFRYFVRQAGELHNIVHVRPAVPENAAMFVAQCLAVHPYQKKVRTTVPDQENPGSMKTEIKEETVWLKTQRFPDLRRKKSLPNVKELLLGLEK